LLAHGGCPSGVPCPASLSVVEPASVALSLIRLIVIALHLVEAALFRPPVIVAVIEWIRAGSEPAVPATGPSADVGCFAGGLRFV